MSILYIRHDVILYNTEEKMLSQGIKSLIEFQMQENRSLSTLFVELWRKQDVMVYFLYWSVMKCTALEKKLSTRRDLKHRKK